MNAVETRELTHRYGRAEAAVREVALAVPRGSIYGFLGPNGAGKTTTLRLLLGLLRLQRGQVTVLGRSLRRDRREILRRVGSSIETPSLYGDLTATENLDVWRLAYDCPRARIPEVLGVVGLAGAGTKRTRQFSLGMKQRLALAIALLHQPELLVLDEPANGLDPQGILEMRDLLLRLNREHGITILLSSHVLSEVERLVTHVGVIRRGELVFQGPLADLTARGKENGLTALRTSDDARARTLLPEARAESHRLIVACGSPQERAQVVRRLVLAGIDVHEVMPFGRDLEQVFFELVGDA